MKIPKSIKLPRKLKKELKKGFTRNMCTSPMKFSNTPDVVSVSSFFHYTYSGSNTKSFFRLCKAMRKEEKRTFKILKENILKQFDNEIDWMWKPVVFPKWQNEPIISFDPANGDSHSAIFLAEYEGLHLRYHEIHAIIPH